MTAARDTSRRQDKPWIDKLRQELDRAMERERQFRASVHRDRLCQLEAQLANLPPVDQARHRRPAS